MAYNRRNHLLRVIKVQEITLEYQKTGSTLIWIFNHVIHPQFTISYNTYSSYLGINAKAELKKIENADKTI